MEKDAEKIIVNIGCGFRKMEDAINVDAFSNCKPDVLWNLDEHPWPFADNSVDMVHAHHVMEHLDDWWGAFKEVCRILKFGGTFEMYVPCHTDTEAYGYIDHKHVISRLSFHLILHENQRGTNAWAKQQEQMPMMMTQYLRVPNPKYIKWWFPRRLLRFCCEHLVNFEHEQRFSFLKIDR